MGIQYSASTGAKLIPLIFIQFVPGSVEPKGCPAAVPGAALFLETRMNHAFRQFYRPKVSRTPEWLRRLWLWL
jgi:hypothetical protein